MTQLYELKDAVDPYTRSNRVKHNVKIKEREEDRRLQEEANKKNVDNDVSKNFVYVVRRHPWNRKMAKIRRRLSAGEEPIATAVEPVANLGV